jgi:hypothetical protein
MALSEFLRKSMMDVQESYKNAISPNSFDVTKNFDLTHGWAICVTG